MGMHYRYQLVVDTGGDLYEEERASTLVAKYIRSVDEWAECFIDEVGEGSQGEEGDWDFMAALVSASRKFPSWRIKLYADDDCANEHLVNYFVDGKHYWDDGEVAYPEFDEKLLEEVLDVP